MADDPDEKPAMAPTRLRWPRHRLKETLAGQIALGEEIRATCIERPNPRYNNRGETISVGATWLIDHERVQLWSDRNREILREAFITEDVLLEYDPYANVRDRDDHWMIIRTDRFHFEPRPPGAQRSRRRLARSRWDKAHLHELDDGLTRMRVIAGLIEFHVFVVHGRDHGTRDTVSRTLRQLTGDEPVILQEQPDGGDTVIEKFERLANAASAAVVILTPDDVGGLAGDRLQLQPRARQNVVYELGWFHGRLGRGRVIALLVDDVEQPSDISGVLYLQLDPAGAWRYRLGHELAHIGIDVDLNTLR